MNYRIPRATCLAANYPVRNDPFLDVNVCLRAGVCVVVERVEKLTRTGWCHMDRGQLCVFCVSFYTSVKTHT